METCDSCRYKDVTANARPCRTCEGYNAWIKPTKNKFSILFAAVEWWRDRARFLRGCVEEYEKESDWQASEITKLRAALSEALDSLDLATSDCLLMALASKRALAKFKDSDGEPCRWCESEEDIHADHCPVHVLVDIGFVGLIGDEVMRRSMEEFVEEEDRKRREARP